MSDSRDRHDSSEQGDTNEQRDTTEQQDATPPKAGGFGAFSGQYRDRWAANHPNSKRIHGEAASAPTPPVGEAGTPAEAGDREPEPEQDTKR